MTVHLRIHTQKGGMLSGQYPEAFQFPGGEWHLSNIPEVPAGQGKITFIADMRGADADDIVKAALWRDVASRLNFDIRTDPRFVLMVPYLPAARADRGMPLGVTVYARLLRSLNPDRIITMDPHSEQSLRSYMLGSLRVVDHLPLMGEAVEVTGQKFDGVICPDKGAIRRSEDAAKYLGVDLYRMDKHRDFATGKITGMEMLDEIPRTGKYLVADDICDGGGTFHLLADTIDLPREQLGLWITHSIFSGAAPTLNSRYSWIGTTDSHPGRNSYPVATVVVPCFLPMLDLI